MELKKMWMKFIHAGKEGNWSRPMYSHRKGTHRKGRTVFKSLEFYSDNRPSNWSPCGRNWRPSAPAWVSMALTLGLDTRLLMLHETTTIRTFFKKSLSLKSKVGGHWWFLARYLEDGVIHRLSWYVIIYLCAKLQLSSITVSRTPICPQSPYLEVVDSSSASNWRMVLSMISRISIICY